MDVEYKAGSAERSGDHSAKHLYEGYLLIGENGAAINGFAVKKIGTGLRPYNLILSPAKNPGIKKAPGQGCFPKLKST